MKKQEKKLPNWKRCFRSANHLFPINISEEEIEILQAVSNHAAVTIYHTRLAQEIAKTKNDLLTHKRMQRAKSILMKDYQISEDNAHRLLLKKSMDSGKPLLEIAEIIIAGAAIKPD